MPLFPAKPNDLDYAAWRDSKLSKAIPGTQSSLIHLTNAVCLDQHERQQLIQRCQQHNFALYQFDNPSQNQKSVVHNFAAQLGLQHLSGNLCADTDQLSSITVTQHSGQPAYIPYTAKKLSWHTDGYYNPTAQQIHGMLLHCIRPATNGGISYLLDHELAYILLRDENPAYIDALFASDALTIPANIIKGKIIRPAQSGPVFSITPQGRLHMRYSARLRNIEWKNDSVTHEAAAFLQALWKTGNPLIIEYKLEKSQGILCNNILHARTAFEDDAHAPRLLLRGRYYDSIGHH